MSYWLKFSGMIEYDPYNDASGGYSDENDYIFSMDLPQGSERALRIQIEKKYIKDGDITGYVTYNDAIRDVGKPETYADDIRAICEYFVKILLRTHSYEILKCMYISVVGNSGPDKACIISYNQWANSQDEVLFIIGNNVIKVGLENTFPKCMEILEPYIKTLNNKEE